MGIDLHFTDEDWRRVQRDWSAWWSGQTDRAMVIITRWEPPGGRQPAPAPSFVPQLPLAELSDEQVVDRYQAHLEAARFHGDAWPKWWVNFGPGAMAAFCGSSTTVDENTVWFDPPPGAVKIDELHFRLDPDNPWWRRVLGLTRSAVARWGDRVCVAHTDIGGNLDALASFLTTQGLLYALHDHPREVDRLVSEITRVWLEIYDELHEIVRPAGRGTSPWAPIWSPRTTYMLQCDFCYMISPAMFERFVLPDLVACCDRLEHGFYHLDGKGAVVHLDMLLGIERLRGVQWVPGAGQPEAAEWPELLKRIRDAGKLCQVWASPGGALKIVRRFGGAGFALAVDGFRSTAEVAEFLAELHRAGRRR